MHRDTEVSKGFIWWLLGLFEN